MRAHADIGHNGGPPTDLGEFDRDFISARLIQRGAEFVQFTFRHVQGLENLLVKRKGSRAMAYRHVLAYALRGLMPIDSMARILGLNRKTLGENMRRPEVWANHDSEEGRRMDAALEDLCEATYRYAKLDPGEVDSLVTHFVKMDRDLRRIEAECRAAALAADRAADALEAKKEAERLAGLASLSAALDGAPQKEAILAQHRGARDAAAKLSVDALGVLAHLARAAHKGRKTRRSELNATAEAECISLGVIQDAEPFLSKAIDPARAITAFGQRVLLEAHDIGRIQERRKG